LKTLAMPVLPIEGLGFDKFNEKELRSLKLFHKQVEMIWESRIIKTDSLRSNIHFDFTRSDDAVTAQFPDEDDLRSLVTLVRACLLQNNSIFHKTILGILQRHSVGETYSYLKKSSELFFRSLNGVGLITHIDGQEFSDEQIFDMWLNGYYFHFDDQKTKGLESFGNQDYMAKSSLVSMLIAYCGWSIFLNLIIKDYIEPL
jgi:hypothetical protein